MPVELGGELVTVLIEQEGPIAFAESTTLNVVFAEDENRCISLFTDEQPDQTRAVIELTAAASAGEGQPQQGMRTVHVHHAMQRMLRRRDVVIPYARELGKQSSSERVEARR